MPALSLHVVAPSFPHLVVDAVEVDPAEKQLGVGGIKLPGPALLQNLGSARGARWGPTKRALAPPRSPRHVMEQAGRVVFQASMGVVGLQAKSTARRHFARTPPALPGAQTGP